MLNDSKANKDTQEDETSALLIGAVDLTPTEESVTNEADSALVEDHADEPIEATAPQPRY